MKQSDEKYLRYLDWSDKVSLLIDLAIVSYTASTFWDIAESFHPIKQLTNALTTASALSITAIMLCNIAAWIDLHKKTLRKANISLDVFTTMTLIFQAAGTTLLIHYILFVSQ